MENLKLCITEIQNKAKNERKKHIREKLPTGYWDGVIDACDRILKIINNDNLKNFSYEFLIEILKDIQKIHVYKCIQCSDPKQGLDVGSICINCIMPDILGTEWEEII